MEKINWNKKRNELANIMEPCTFWNEGTALQQELADKLVSSFCKRFAKYLCWGIQNGIIELTDATNIAYSISSEISNIDNAKWWCNKKSANDFTIASKLLESDENNLNIVKVLKKEYN